MLQFKIQIEDIKKPHVWRRVLVPETRAFGWENCHLYSFSPEGYGSYPMISIPSKEDWGPVTDATIKLNTNLTDYYEKGTFYL